MTTAAQKAAKGQPCMLRIPDICNWDWETTVLAHTGSGTGKRRDDADAVYACSSCHSAIDYRSRRFLAHDQEIQKVLHEDRIYFIQQAKNRMSVMNGQKN